MSFVTKRENLISLFKRQGYNEVPVDFSLCPSLYEVFKRETKETDYEEYFGFPWRSVGSLRLNSQNEHLFRQYYKDGLKDGTYIDWYGVAHEPGSAAAKHMTRMRHPLEKADSIEQMKEYPFPNFLEADGSHQKKQVEEIHARGLAARGRMEVTIWETSWYIRGMEELLVDMMMEDEKAEYLLDKVTEGSCIRIASFASAGVDIVDIGDDIGMQNSIMMSEKLYRTWIKPRIKRVIETAKKINPDIIIKYHSCGYIRPFINDLIEVGVDVLNPVQPECMDFKEIHAEFGDRVSFHGTIGTQTTMPFGSVEDVKREVYRNLNIAGTKGGLFCAPTHLLEPEVPFENILAYVEACKSFV